MREKNVVLTNKVILVIGAAGFIGSNLVLELLRAVHPVHIIGIDNMNDYYDVSIKEYRLEQIERSAAEHLVYASSSSVYGTNKKVPYSTEDKADNPVSLYAATKKSNELMAHAYSKLYNIPSSGGL